MRTAGTRAEVLPAPQAWGSPRADSLFPEEGRRGSGRRVWRGSGGKNPGTVGPEEQQGRAGLGQHGASVASLVTQSLRLQDSLWGLFVAEPGLGHGSRCDAAIPGSSSIHVLPPSRFPASLAAHLGLWG